MNACQQRSTRLCTKYVDNHLQLSFEIIVVLIIRHLLVLIISHIEVLFLLIKGKDYICRRNS